MKRIEIAGTAAAAALVVSSAGCAAGADAEEPPQPTVVESLAAAEEGEDELPSENGDEQSDETPQEDPEPTPVPASSEGPAQNWPAPEPPEEIFTPTEEGAEALLQYWFDARHYARITGDTKPLEEVSHEDCAMCDGHIDQINDVYPDAWFVEDEADLVIDVFVRLESTNKASGLFAIRSVSFEAYRDGELDAEDPGGRESGFGIGFMFNDEHWQIHDLRYLGDYEDDSFEQGETSND